MYNKPNSIVAQPPGCISTNDAVAACCSTGQSPGVLLPNAAVAYARQGLRVFPLRAGTKDRFRLHKPRPGRPTTALHLPGEARGGFYQGTNDEELTRARWAAFPRSNIGLRTGGGLAVVDVDPRNGGTPPSWVPATLTAATPTGGHHFYLHVDVPVRSGPLTQGVDLKAEGGYVVAAPSEREEGSYEWVEIRPLAHIDAGLLLKRQGHGSRRGGAGREHARGEPFEPCGHVYPGMRHDELTRWAGWLRAQGYKRDEIEQWLFDVNETFEPPLEDDKEILAIADWAGGLPR